MERKQSIILVSAFLGAPVTHGGVRRSQQIYDELAEVMGPDGIQVVPLGRLQGFPVGMLQLWRALASIPRMMPTLLRLMALGAGMLGLLRALRYGPAVLEALRACPDALVVAEISPGAGLIGALCVLGAGRKYVAVPHNIEFMVPGQREGSFVTAGAHAHAEILVYRRALFSWAISAFDAAILQSLGGRAVCMPYRPTGANLERCRAVRQSRATALTCGILMVGSCSNPPTYKAMEDAVRELQDKGFAHSLTVIGLNTEQLGVKFPGSGICFMGAVDDSALDAILSGVKAVVIGARQTTGFITRISDSILSSCPLIILGDYLQAHEFQRYGIRCTREYSEAMLEAVDGVLGPEAFEAELDRDVRAAMAELLAFLDPEGRCPIGQTLQKP